MKERVVITAMICQAVLIRAAGLQVTIIRSLSKRRDEGMAPPSAPLDIPGLLCWVRRNRFCKDVPDSGYECWLLRKRIKACRKASLVELLH